MFWFCSSLPSFRTFSFHLNQPGNVHVTHHPGDVTGDSGPQKAILPNFIARVALKWKEKDELIEIGNRGWPLNTGPLFIGSSVAIFHFGIKGQGFKDSEFTILIWLCSAVFRFWATFYCAFRFSWKFWAVFRFQTGPSASLVTGFVTLTC